MEKKAYENKRHAEERRDQLNPEKLGLKCTKTLWLFVRKDTVAPARRDYFQQRRLNDKQLFTIKSTSISERLQNPARGRKHESLPQSFHVDTPQELSHPSGSHGDRKNNLWKMNFFEITPVILGYIMCSKTAASSKSPSSTRTNEVHLAPLCV